MQEERRKYKRLDLDVNIQLQRVNEGDITIEKYLHVDVLNASEGGLAFRSTHELEVGTCHDTKLVIWTKEEIRTVLKIVRVTEKEDIYEYGCIFVGMSSSDTLKIQIYQMIHDNED